MGFFTRNTAHESRVMHATRWHGFYLTAAALIFFADQITKAWVVREIPPGTARRIIKGFLAFVYAENTGIAFGQLQSGGAAKQWILIALACVALFGVMLYFFRTAATHDRILGACALLAGGILGNLADRVRLGYVIDFILVYWGDWSYPVFNIADASICTGAGLLILDAILSGRKKESGVRGQESE